MANSPSGRLISYWRTVLQSGRPSRIFSPFRAVLSVLIAMIAFFVQSHGKNGHLLQSWIAVATIIGVYLALYIVESLWSLAVISPANLHDTLTKENSQLKELISKLEGHLSARGIEILLAAYDGLERGSGNIMVTRSALLNSVYAGNLLLARSDSEEAAEYVAEVEALLTGGWLNSPSTSNGDYHELSRKGLAKAKDLLNSPEGKGTLESLKQKFRQH